MTSIKQAVANAMEFAASVLEPPRTQDMRVEEVKSGITSANEPAWLITLSMRRPIKMGAIEIDLYSDGRDFKTFTVQKETGEVLAMEIRELAGHSA